MKDISNLIQPSIDKSEIMGAAVAILQDGQIVYTGGFGQTTIAGHGIPITDKTLFVYGSIAKNVCAALIMRLVEQNLLDLDRPILTYLPDLEFSNPLYGKRITLRHLLSHTTGLPSAGKDFGPRDTDALRRFVYEQIPHYKFLAEPGIVHLYSSTVLCIAGHIAEVVTGKYYDDLVRELVFEPLQMTRTTFDPTGAMTYPLALPHEVNTQGEVSVSHKLMINASGNPSGFGYTCATDLANLAQMYLNDGLFGGDQFLTPESVKEMQKMERSCLTDQAIPPHGHGFLGYGLGFEISQYRGKEMVGHGGIQLSYNCTFRLFPNENAAVVVLSHYAPMGAGWQVMKSLFDYALDLPKPKSLKAIDYRPELISLKEKELQQYVGSFLNVEVGHLVKFSVDQERLLLEELGEESKILDAVGKHQFCSIIEELYLQPITFAENDNGAITHVMIGGEPYFHIKLNDVLQPDLHQWEVFEGVYQDPSNKNIDETLSIRIKDNELFVSEGSNEFKMHPIDHHSFLTEIGLIEFEGDFEDKGSIILMLGKAVCYYPKSI